MSMHTFLFSPSAQLLLLYSALPVVVVVVVVDVLVVVVTVVMVLVLTVALFILLCLPKNCHICIFITVESEKS